ncbi:MAG: NADH-quinone oxidoreductase subunit M [Thiolinea sp.]
MGITYTDIAAGWPLLLVLQLIPLLTGLLLLKLRGRVVFVLAALAGLTEVVLTFLLYLGLDTTQPLGVMQYAEQVQIFGALQYHAAVDGMSVLFLLLSSILGLLCVVFILFRRLHGTAVLAVMLLIQATLVSQFVTLDLLWFTLMALLEVMLVAYLTLRWSTSLDVLPALSRYGLFMSVGLVLFLAGVLITGWLFADQNGGRWSFDLYDLSQLDLTAKPEALIFFLLFYGLAIRIPLFPFHGWLPDFLMYGNVAIAAIYLLGVKVGVYAMLRFVFPLTAQAVEEWHIVAAAFAMTGVFYAAFLALQCTNLRRLLAFAVISHTGILTIGLFTLHKAALQGSVMLATSFGLATSGLLLMTGLVWQRTGTTNLQRLGGMFDYIPLVGVAFLVAGLAIVGMPGTPGFNAVHLVLEGSILSFGALVTIAAAIGNLIAAGFLLRSFQRTFLGKPEGSTEQWDTGRVRVTESILAGTVILITVVVGFYDEPWLALTEQAVGGLEALWPDRAGSHGGHQ